ncbi:MAG: methyltransferase domain-containing protein [Austwickia sp.]|nr:methyltransferase domain-containing protein [Austwickia sp.]
MSKPSHHTDNNVSSGQYTHGHHPSVVSMHQRRTAQDSAAFLLAHLRPGQALLDLGCGPGSITLDLAARVAPGPVLGVDASATVIETARAAAAERADCTTRFAVGDLYALDLPDDSFDIVFAHQVLQHLTDPVAALREMARVIRPGGLIAVRDADFATFSWYPAHDGLTRWLALYREVCHANGAQPDAGRRLPAWARAAGLTDVQVSTSTWSYHDPSERTAWAHGWAHRVTESALGDRARELDLADSDELAAIADAWHDWAREPDGWFAMIHGELIARIG